jgi:hypothetical protein
VLTSFYSSAASVSFALLGLWWVALQFRYRDWIHDRGRRRRAYSVSMFFLLPGIMSLTSLLADRLASLWQVGFTIAGSIGIVESVGSFRLGRAMGGPAALRDALRVASVALYGLVVALAVRPQLAMDLGIDLTGREVEAVILAVLIFLGVNMVWLMFFEEPFERGPDDESRARAPER